MKLDELITEIRDLHRHREAAMKRRVAAANQLLSLVAIDAGYFSRDDESSREEAMAKARACVDAILAGESHPLSALVVSGQGYIDAFLADEGRCEKKMTKLAKSLPVADWVDHPDRAGFGFFGLAKIVGECGDLTATPTSFSSPCKLWKFLALAPIQARGKTHAGSTWRSGKHGTLTAKEWEEARYSPRRRSLMFNIAEPLMKCNKGGPYKACYDAAKVKFADSHPETNPTCPACKGVGKNKGGTKDCAKCAGKGRLLLHAHKHAMLVMTKKLVKDLWCAWNPTEVRLEAELARVREKKFGSGQQRAESLWGA